MFHHIPYHAVGFFSEHSSPNFIKLLTCIYMYFKLSENSVDPDQLASYKKPADLDLHCFQNRYI